jgi:glycosyltransferase 2 family protein
VSVAANRSAPQSQSGPNWKRRITAGVGLAVTAALMGVLASRVDGPRVLSAVRSISWPSLSIAAGLLAAAYACKIARWHVMLTSVAPALPLLPAAQTLLGSVALNNVLPLRAGDVARVFAFRDLLGVPAAALLPMLLLERVLDAGMLLILAALVAVAMGDALIPSAFGGWSALGLAVAIGLAVLALAAGPGADVLMPIRAAALRWLPAKLQAPVTHALDVLARQLRGRQGFKLLVLTALAWGFEGGMLAALASGFGFAKPLLAGYFACALATLATLVPSAPGFFGTFHAAAIAAVETFGASPDQAAAFAILAHGIMWLPLTAIGLVCLAWLSARRLITQAPAPETP